MAPFVDLNTSPQLVLIIVPSVLLVFSTIAVAGRFYARTLMKEKHGWDDWLTLASLIFAYGLQVTLCIGVAYGGVGVSVMKLQPENLVVYLKTLIASGAVYGTAVAFAQISILCLYIRLFKVIRWHNIACYIVIALCVAWWIAFFGGTMGDCVPLKRLWTPTVPGRCVDQNKACGSTGIAHIILDLIILILPLPVIWKLKANNNRKILLSVLFLMGIFATICSVLRISCIVGLVKIDHNNFTESVWMSFLFESLEVATAILCSCCPAFPIVLKKAPSSRLGSYTKRLFGSLRSDSRSRSYGSDPFSSKKEGSGELPHYTSSAENTKHSKEPSRSQIALVRLDTPDH